MARTKAKDEARRQGKKGVRVPEHPRDLTWHLSQEERYAAGKALRKTCPRESHGSWKAPAGRSDPLDTVLAAEKGRMPELLPLRHGRMARSPFTFYRGSALAMAADLASTPSTGVRVQCCGDAHLSNFGGFATPERRVIFSINDLDETLPAPWEWDVKRLAASFVVACRDNDLKDPVAKDVARTCVRSYRKSMAGYSELRTLELWYESLEPRDLLRGVKDPAVHDRVAERLKKERSKSKAEEIFPKLVEHRDEKPFIRDQLPTLFHHPDHPPGEIQKIVRNAIAGYRATLPHAYQSLLDRYELRDAAIKVVGIGSVGTACWVLLFMAGEGDPLFLQVKEARPSVLERYAGRSAFSSHGQRVVNGYRLMQPASDIFLGWTRTPRRDYFVRQLRDVKISVRVETFDATLMDLYATWCGRALALSHARSGLSSVLSGYMGRSDAFDEAIATFSMAYADQNEADHAVLERAVRKKRLEAVFEEDR
ncbi:MAG TPA: DUF2252 domain-containing protein [Anaeromyxobacteraceae bacterium]|nr:DUF2252 domain-containing protein [Anaeromyxobacteraceae bacterium]